jgi:DNA mismatch repair protein MutS
MALIKEYFHLTKKYQDEYGENTILLMQVGSFFEVYGKNNKKTNTISGSKISDFSQICELNVVEKNVCVGEDDILMAGFKDIMIDKYLKKIPDAGFTAVVYTQDEAMKNTTRSCAGVFSPGTYFSSEPKKLTNNITCIWVDLIENKIILKGKYVVVGIANIDILTGKTSIFQFKEVYLNSPTTYDELERFISIYNPSEVIVISNLSEIDDIISYAGIKSNLIHKIYINANNINDQPTQKSLRAVNCEKQIYQKEILKKFYQMNDFDVFYQNFYDNNISAQAFCYLLDFVYQHNPYLVNKISEPIFENCTDRLILANHTLKQLNIIDDSNYSGKYSSVLKILNNCLTPMGKRKFDYSFLNPTTNIEFLQREYDITEYFMTYLSDEKYNSFLRFNLSNIKDISKNERQIFLKKISPKSFYNLYNNILSISTIYDKISEDLQVMNYFNIFEKNTFHIKEFCDEITNFIKTNINLELAKDIDQIQNYETNFIERNIDDELDKKTDMLNESELKLESIREYLSGIIENKEKKGKSSEYVKIHETEKNNYTLICTSRRCKLLQDALPLTPATVKLNFTTSENIKKMFELNVSKNQFSFVKQTASNNSIVDEQTNNLCKNINTNKMVIKNLIGIVFNKFVEKFESYQEKLESIIHFITLVDVLYSKCTIAKKYNYCKPNITKADKSFVDAKGLRHCLIEHLQNNEIYVSNDLLLGDGKNDGILLYGTNAVGKTSLIKALGISLIMAQSGLFVPCSSFSYFPYKYIFTRILGNDNIFKGLSTFAVEMSELRTILRLADPNSLILGDELCSGTENTSAISIFVAGIQKLHQYKSSFIFATHLHEIVDYEEITSLETVSLKHMSVIYNKEQDVLIYDRKLKDGPGNNLYGLEVCKSLSLPTDFLEAAYNIRLKYNPESGSLLSLKTSRYNSKKIVSLCEKCGKNMGTEVHHMQHQVDADKNGFISNMDSTFHKNNLANLMTLCDVCHNAEHKTAKKGSKRVKTTKGSTIDTIH